MNCMKKALVCVAAATSAMFVTATPEVSDVTMTQRTGSRLVTITYKLTEDAVVTLDVLTNATPNASTGWASIGGKAVCYAQGAVWRKVTSADADGNGNYTITWRPDHSWTDEFGNGFKIADGCAKVVVTAWALDNTPDYMVVDISAGAQQNTQRYYPRSEFVPGGVTSDVYKTSALLMRKIMAKGVTWYMGSTDAESPLRFSTREATHQVTLTNNYYIGVYEITQSQWGEIGSGSGATANFTAERSMRPMENVSYNEIRTSSSTTANSNYNWPKDPNPSSFLGRLKSRTGILFDLPSEAQWEFAARAGHGSGYWGDGSAIKNETTDSHMAALGRYLYDNPGGSSDTGTLSPSEGGTAIVGSYAPNSWGLYDMNGNVWEWCLDWFQANIATATDTSGELYAGRVNINPSSPENCLSGGAPDSSNARVKRGGAWNETAQTCRPAFRQASMHGYCGNVNGLRVVCTAGLE